MFKRIKNYFKQKSEWTRDYNQSIDYKQFDRILHSFYESMPCEYFDTIFKEAYFVYGQRRCPYHRLSIDEFAKEWRSWGKQTGMSFYNFEGDK